MPIVVREGRDGKATMNLYEFDHTSSGNYRLDLTPATLCELTGIDENRLSGMFGSGSVAGRVKVMYDEDQTWQDVAGDFTGSGCEYALFIEPGMQSSGYTCTSLYDDANPKLAAFANAIERMYDDEHDERNAHEVLTRYGALLGLEVDFLDFNGRSPSDWLPVITVQPIGVENNPIENEMRQYWDGEIYGYDIWLEGPLGDNHVDSCWGFVGEECILEHIASELRGMVREVSREIREAKAAA